jgi:SAM-dependent methyltransferase
MTQAPAAIACGEDEPRLMRKLARAVVPERQRPVIAGAVRSWRYRGTGVECPCCDGRFSSFRSHRGRAQAKCPRCGALERHRLLVLYLREEADLFYSSLSVLHLAPEFAIQRRLRSLPNLRYRSADLESSLAMDRADVQALPYPDASFDVVICNHVLEHVDDDHRALDEIRRVLRSCGRAILLSPIDQERSTTLEDPGVTSSQARHRVFGQSDHVRRYGRDFAQRVSEHGFEVTTVPFLDSRDGDTVTRMRLRRGDDLFPRDDIFVCVAA